MRTRSLASARRAITLTLAAALMAALVATGPVGAQSGATDKGAPAPAAPPPAPEDCALQDEHQPHDEWLSCLQITTELHPVPAVGETATLKVSVRADGRRPASVIEVDLPPMLEWDAAPPGASVRDAKAKDGVGSVHRASMSTDLVKGSAKTFTARVRAVAPGQGQISARITSMVDAAFTDGANTFLPLTIGDDGAGSSPSVPNAAASGEPLATVAAPAPSGASAPDPEQTVPLPGGEPAPTSPTAQAPACATGSWVYTHPTDGTKGNFNFQVQAWDQDPGGTDDLLATGVTASNGAYSLCYDNTDVDAGGLVDVYIRFVSENSRWRLQDNETNDNLYIFTSGVQTNASTAPNFGSLQPADGNLMRGMHAFDTANKLFFAIPRGANNCWDANDAAAACRQYRINWTASSTDGTYNDLDGGVHLAADDPNSEHTTIHELAHGLMDDVYEDDYPPFPNCNPHFINSNSSTGCAWTEGFAEWLPALVMGDKLFRWPSGATLDFENRTWGYGGHEGDQAEGNVAAAMIDISDAENEGPWDTANLGFPGSQYTTFLNQLSDTFSEFVTIDMPAQGFPFADATVASAVYQNTIDYGFRNPLTSNVSKLFPTPRPHNYQATTNANYWSVVAVRPPSGGDYDLRLFSNRAMTTQLASSTFGGSAVDYIAVDGNRTGSGGTYFPQAYVFSGSGNYAIEWESQAASVGDGTASLTLGNLVTVRDTFMTAGVPTFFRMVPSSGLQLGASLHRSTAGTASSYTQGRSSAFASSSSSTLGGEVAFTATDATSQWDGLVLAAQSGTGTVTVYRDTTAPAGSASIDGGAARTNTQNVTVGIGGTDSQTGIKDMRVSTDGTFDTEPWQAFTSSTTATLPAGDGVKTVWVQLRNNALMTAMVSDTIQLDSRPDLVVTVVDNPPGQAFRGDTITLGDTTKNIGPTNATGSNTKYYLSLDTILDSTDRAMGNRSAGPLAAGASSTGTKSVTVPATMKKGVYHVLACADAGAGVDEFDEANNCTASVRKITIRVPDLVVTAVSSPPTTGTAGTVFTVQDTTKNSGNTDVTVNTQTRYYLSLNVSLDAADVALTNGGRTVGPLAPQATDTGSKNVTVPGGTAAGKYYVLACSDNNGVVDENSETNNCRRSPTKITIS